jgi:hypothetical protein
MGKDMTMSEHVRALYKKPNVTKAEELIMRVTNYAWSEMTLTEQQELREQAAAELARLQAIEAAVRERTKNAIGLFDGGHGKKYAYCNDCRAIGATLEPDSIKHNRGCLVAALAPTQPGDDEKG